MWANMAETREAAEKSFEAYQTYYDQMFPFLERLQESGVDKHARLLEHIKRPMMINMGALRQELAGKAHEKALAKFSKFKLSK